MLPIAPILVVGFFASGAAWGDARLDEAVAEHLGLFVTVPERREANERIVLSGSRLEIWFLQPMERRVRQQALCDGFRWLLAGRLDQNGGIGGLFAALGEISHVTLVFYGLETKVTPDAEGKYTQTRKPVPKAQYTVSRDKAALLSKPLAAKVLRGPRCVTEGEALVDVFWTDEAGRLPAPSRKKAGEE